jgi:hypothetical protein
MSELDVLPKPTRSKLDVWTTTKNLLEDLRDVDQRAALEFFLYQEHLSLEKVQILSALVQYLLAKQTFETNLKETLHELTKNFTTFLMKK